VNIFERAKNIRLKGESWQNCIQRAKAQVNYELQLGGEGKERKTKNRIRSDIPFVYSKGPTMRTSRKSGRKKVGKGCVLNISEDSDHEGWCISREEAEKHNIKYLADSNKVCKTSRKRRTGNVTCRRRRNSRGELLGSDLPKPRLSEKQKQNSYSRGHVPHNKHNRQYKTDMVPYSKGGARTKYHPNPTSNIRPDGKKCLVSNRVGKGGVERKHCTSNPKLQIEGTDSECGWTRKRDSGRLECRRNRSPYNRSKPGTGKAEPLDTPPQLQAYLKHKGGYFSNDTFSDTSGTRTSDFTNVSDTTSYTMSGGSDYSYTLNDNVSVSSLW
jgi:hypothetical protein